jgi:cyclohexanecarboxylate-CoA ligase
VAERLEPTWPHALGPTTGRVSDLEPDDLRIARLAGGLAGSGVGCGDLVAWQLPNGEPAALALWACWRLGAVAAPIHHRATAAEVERMLGALPKATVLDDRWISRLVEESPPHPGGPAAPGEPALVLHTSGSSGTPKAVVHTHGGLAHKARSMVRIHGLGAEDVVLMPAPLGHVSGVLNGVLVPAAAHMRTVLLPRWDPDEALAIIEGQRVSFMVGPPTFFTGLRDASGWSPERVASLRIVSAGGAGVSAAFCEQVAAEFGTTVKRSYGSTEAPTVATNHADDDVRLGWDTDGRAVDGVSFRIGDAGELEVRGPELFVGYTDAERTAEAVTADGWFRTGDLAELGEDARVTITGRLSEVIIRGGENISPAEVEAVLEAHPEVRAAVVVGVPDERLGERAAAVIVPVPGVTLTLDEVTAWCGARGLARYKWPERVELVESFPVLASGKADRFEMRRRLDRPV